MNLLQRYFNRLSNHPQAFLLAISLGVILVLPSLAAGFFADDFTHFVLINEGSFVRQPENLSLFHLFSFVDTNIERRIQLYGLSIMPWWSSPDFSLIFFRPFSELTHYLDYYFLKTHIPLMHLHSIIWYGILLALLARFYQTFCSTPKIALLALLFFVADATHGFTVAWLANRNALLAALFTLAAILGHHQFRETGNRWSLALSIGGIIFSFLSAEAGIVVGVFLFAYALFMDKAGPAKGLLYLLPALVIFLIWMGIYKHYHYGASGNRAYYIDPIESPALFFANLPDRLMRTIAMQFNLLPIHLIKPYPLPMTIIGSALFIALLLPLKQAGNKQYRFFLCILLLSIIPITSAELQDRNMLFVGIAACPILAGCLRYLSRQPRRLFHSVAWIILIFHLLISGVFMMLTAYSPQLLARSSITTANSLPDNISEHYILTFGAPIFDASYVAAIRRTNGQPLPRQLWNVTTSSNGLTIQRLGTHEFIITNPNGLFSGIDTMLRDVAFDPINPGERIDMGNLILTVKTLSDEGVPVSALLQIGPAIKQNAIALYYWQKSQLIPFSLENHTTRQF